MGMLAKLSDDLVQELERIGDEPLFAENPRNHKLYIIIAKDRFPEGKNEESPPVGTSNWTEEKNSRRFTLIDKDIAGTLSSTETVELQRLQREIDEYLCHVAPLPFAATRALHEQLRRTLGSSTPS